MKLVGFTYDKISAEKYTTELKDLKIETSLNIDSIEENPAKSPNPDIKFLNFSFTSSINYSKKIAKIELVGKMVLSVDSSLAKNILKDWKKKELKDEVRFSVFNGILEKTNIKALQLEEELNLPPHFRLPSLAAPGKQ